MIQQQALPNEFTQNPSLETKLEAAKKEFAGNAKLVQDLQAIFQQRMEMELQYLNAHQRLTRTVETFSKNFLQFCPDLLGPFESFHAIQLEQQEKLVQNLNIEISQQTKNQAADIFKQENELFTKTKDLIKAYNQMFIDIPKCKIEYLKSRDELSLSWESLSEAQMNSTSFKNVEKCQKRFQTARQKKEETAEILHQKLKNLRRANRFYSEADTEVEGKYEELEIKKSELVFDSISRYLVGEIHYMTSLQYDFKNILAKLNDEEGKEKIKLLRLSEIEQANVNQQTESTSSSKQSSIGKSLNELYQGDVAKLQSRALEFLKKMSNPGVKEQKSSGVISVEDNELDGVLADEWRLILKEAQQRSAQTQPTTNENKSNNGNNQIMQPQGQEIQPEKAISKEIQSQQQNVEPLRSNSQGNDNNQSQDPKEGAGGFNYFNSQDINQALH